MDTMTIRCTACAWARTIERGSVEPYYLHASTPEGEGHLVAIVGRGDPPVEGARASAEELLVANAYHRGYLAGMARVRERAKELLERL